MEENIKMAAVAVGVFILLRWSEESFANYTGYSVEKFALGKTAQTPMVPTTAGA